MSGEDTPNDVGAAGRPTPPSPMEFAGPADGRYPGLPAGVPEHDDGSDGAGEWKVKRAYWRFRTPPAGEPGEFRTCPATNQEVPLDEWHIRVVARRETPAGPGTSSVEQRTFHFRTVEDYVSWMEGDTTPV